MKKNNKSLKRTGAVHKRRVTVDSAELPKMTGAAAAAATMPEPLEDLEPEPEALPVGESVEKRSRVSTIKTKFREKLRTNSAINLIEKVDLGWFATSLGYSGFDA